MPAGTFGFAHKVESSIFELRSQIDKLERRLAESPAHPQNDDSGEYLVHKVREAEIRADLAAKRAELDKLSRRTPRDTRPLASRTHSFAIVPEARPKADDLGGPDQNLPALSTSALPSATMGQDLRPSAHRSEIPAWMKARRMFRGRGEPISRGRRTLMYAAGLCGLALSAFALLSAAGLPYRGARGVAASPAVDTQPPLLITGHVQAGTLGSFTAFDEAAGIAPSEVVSQQEVVGTALSADVGPFADDIEVASADDDGEALDPWTGLAELGESTHGEEFRLATRTVFTPGFRGVNVRLEPSARSSSLLLVPVGTQVEVLEGRQRVAGQTWVQIRVPDGVEGWILARSLAG